MSIIRWVFAFPLIPCLGYKSRYPSNYSKSKPPILSPELGFLSPACIFKCSVDFRRSNKHLIYTGPNKTNLAEKTKNPLQVSPGVYSQDTCPALVPMIVLAPL